MSKISNKNLGEFEVLVLAAILRQANNAYGASIKREIEERTGRKPSLGALYATLTRMEAKNYIKSRLGEATAERGGRAKRYYDLEPIGQSLLEQSVTSMRNMTEGLVAWRIGT